MIRNSLVATALLLSLAACAAPQKQLDSNPAYSSHQYTSSDLEISWKSEKIDNALRIEGTVTNVRTSYIYNDLQLEAALLDSGGNVIAKQTHSFGAFKFSGAEPFKMIIPLESGMKPEQIKFNYRYGIDEDRFSINFKSRL
ncbi:MAG: hypothetical protein ACYDHC_00685 [Desulfuromonadaceae bacterium]